jgi:hypothetical protein
VYVEEKQWNECEAELKIELYEPEPVIAIGLEQVGHHENVR